MQPMNLPPLPPGIGPADPGLVAEAILPAFNAQLDLRAAYKWDRPEVFQLSAPRS